MQSPPRSPGTRLTERDLRLLEFVAEHRFVLPSHVQAFLGTSAAAAYARLRALTTAGYLMVESPFDRTPRLYRASRAGLRAIGSSYPSPRLDLGCYRHDVGAAWLWLHARAGTFGPMREVISERRMRSQDARADRVGDPLAVRLGGLGPGGRERLHYPDLLLVTPQGKRIAVELELTGKSRTRREQILGGYGADRRIDAVLYLVEKPGVARAIRDSAGRLGIGDLIHVQPFRWGEGDRAGGRAAASRAAAQRTRLDREHEGATR